MLAKTFRGGKGKIEKLIPGIIEEAKAKRND